MKFGPFSFRRALHLIRADRTTDSRILVRYRLVDPSIFDHKIGVYIVALDDEIVYCGSYRRGFRKRWLYTREEYLYHFKYSIIADSLDAGRQVYVFTESENILKDQIGQCDNPLGYGSRNRDPTN